MVAASCDDIGPIEHAHVFKIGNFPCRKEKRTIVHGNHSKKRRSILHYSNPDAEYRGQPTGRDTINNAGKLFIEACAVANFKQPAVLPPLDVDIQGDAFACPCRSNYLTATISNGGNGPFQYQWQPSTNGINWSDMGTNSFLALTMPCTVGEGIFVRVNVSSNNNQSDSEVLYVESKSPPYPGDPICPEEIIGGPFGDAKFKDLIEVSPNPFTIETTIKYMLEKEEYTKISVFDSNGNLVVLLVDAVQPKGLIR